MKRILSILLTIGISQNVLSAPKTNVCDLLHNSAGPGVQLTSEDHSFNVILWYDPIHGEDYSLSGGVNMKTDTTQLSASLIESACYSANGYVILNWSQKPTFSGHLEGYLNANKYMDLIGYINDKPAQYHLVFQM